MKVLVILCFVLHIFAYTYGAKILGVFHMPSFSHYQLGAKLLKTLAARGHEVTVISPYSEKSPLKNYKEIVLTDSFKSLEDVNKNIYEQTNEHPITSATWFEDVGALLADETLSHPKVQELIKSDEKFDLVLLEQFVNEAFRGFCHKYSAHCVILNPLSPGRWSNIQMANPGPPSYVTDMNLKYPSKMNFFQRLNNAFVTYAIILYFHLFALPKQNEVMHKHFPDAPHINDLYYNTSLMLVNTHVSVNPPVPLLPNMIPIGGYTMNEPKPLPKSIQDDLDNSKNGAIYFSMGSNLQSKHMSAQKRDAILAALSKLKQTVLWKWEDESLPGQPPNVKLYKWLPQQDILAHPNVKLFITHGGGSSTLETIYHGVPVLGIPVYGDQELNMVNAELAGYGLKLNYDSITEETLTKALNELLNNPKYAENARKRSQYMHDEPIKPIDKAMFWIEYVLRHGGGTHLQTAALHLTWYQYLLLDVIAFYIFILLLSIFGTFKLIKKACCRKSGKVNQNAQKKKN